MNPYLECPMFNTRNFAMRLINEGDSEEIFKCYNDKTAVEHMNDDNCDFGFYADSQEKMLDTVKYWLDFYKKQCFIRFAVVDRKAGKAVGTIEGFGGEIGVLRVDICTSYEKEAYLSEIFAFARDNFHEIFGNEYLVTKAKVNSIERRKALRKSDWEFINTFKGYEDYFKIKLDIK